MCPAETFQSLCVFPFCSFCVCKLLSSMISVFPLGSPVRDSCSATLKDPHQTNMRGERVYDFVVTALQFFILRFVLCVHVFLSRQSSVLLSCFDNVVFLVCQRLGIQAEVKGSHFQLSTAAARNCYH